MINVRGYLLLGIWALVGWTTESVPIHRPCLQHILLRDRVLSLNLQDFIRHRKASFIAISVDIDPADHGYVYHMHNITHYETIRDYKDPTWGEWHHAMLLFYSHVDLRPVCSISDTISLTYLHRYGALLLPRAVIHIPGTKIWRLNVQADGGLEYSFKVVKGQEAYFYDNIGHDNRLVLDSLPPVPESN